MTRTLRSKRVSRQVIASDEGPSTSLAVGSIENDSPAKTVNSLSNQFRRKIIENDFTQIGESSKTHQLNVVTKTPDPKANYAYFAQLGANAVQTPKGHSQSKETTKLEILKQIPTNDKAWELNSELSESAGDVTPDAAVASIGDKTDSGLIKEPPLAKKSFNLAAYVNESETLANLVRLGVDLSRIEGDSDLATFLVKLDFETGVKPHLRFLHDVGVADDDIGTCVTRNADIFRQSLDDLQVRVSYLESKRFTRESIARIVAKAPQILSQPVKRIDAQLGFLQRLFLLNGDEIRQVITRHPKIAVWNRVSIQVMKLTYKEMLGFTESQAKQILLEQPKLYMSGRHAVMKRFNYLHEVIGYSRDALLVWPQVLRTRVFIMRQRHEFLKLIGRDQFDPTQENYVSVKLLVLGSDAEFCANVAKTSVKRYNDFLKTL